MKKKLFVCSVAALAMAFAACSDDKKENGAGAAPCVGENCGQQCVGENCGETPEPEAIVRKMASKKGCALDMDCADGSFCFNGQCVVQCAVNPKIDCDEGYSCDASRGRCVTQEYITELGKIEKQIEDAGDAMSDSEKAVLRASLETKIDGMTNVRRSVLGQKNAKGGTVGDIEFARRMTVASLLNTKDATQQVSFVTKDSIGDVLYAVKMDGVDLPVLKKSAGKQNDDGTWTYEFEIDSAKIVKTRMMRKKLRSGGIVDPDADAVDIVSNAGEFQVTLVDPPEVSGIYSGNVVPDAVLSGTPLPIRMGIQTKPEKVSSFAEITEMTILLPVSGSDLFSPENLAADGKESWASLKMSKQASGACNCGKPCFAADFSTSDYAPVNSVLFGTDQHVNRSIRVEIFDFDVPSLTFAGRIRDRLRGLYRIASIEDEHLQRNYNDTEMDGSFAVTLSNTIDESIVSHEHHSDGNEIRGNDEAPAEICTTNDIKALIAKIKDDYAGGCETVEDAALKAECEEIKKCKSVSSKANFDALSADARWSCIQHIASGITNDPQRLSSILTQVLEADVSGDNTSEPIVTVCGKGIHNFAEFQAVCADKTCSLCDDHPEFVCEADLLARKYLENELTTEDQAKVMTSWTEVIRESYLAQQYLAWNSDNDIRRQWLVGSVYTGTFAANLMNNFNEGLLNDYRTNVLDMHRNVMKKQFNQSTLEMISQSMLAGNDPDHTLSSARNTILADLAQTWESVSNSLGLSTRRYDVLSQNDKNRIQMAKELRPYVFDLYFAAVLETAINLKADQGSLNASFGANMGNIMAKLKSLDQKFEDLVFMRDGEVLVDSRMDPSSNESILDTRQSAADSSIQKAIAKREEVFAKLDQQKKETLSIQDSYLTSLASMRAEIIELCGYPSDCQSDDERESCKIFTSPFYCGFELPSNSDKGVEIAVAAPVDGNVGANSISQNVDLNDCITYQKKKDSGKTVVEINKTCGGGNLELTGDDVSHTDGVGVSEAGLAILEYREADQDYQTALAEYEVLRQKVANNYATADAYAKSIAEWYDKRSENIETLKANLDKMKEYEGLITEYNNNVSQAELDELDAEYKLQSDANEKWYKSAATNLAFQTMFQTVITGASIADIWVSKAADDADSAAQLNALNAIVKNTSLDPKGAAVTNATTTQFAGAKDILGTASAALQTTIASAEGVASIAQMSFDFDMEKLDRDTDLSISKKQQDLAHLLADDLAYFDDTTVKSLKVKCGDGTCDGDELEALIADLKRDSEKLQMDMASEETYKRDMADLDIMRNEFKNLALDLLPLAHTVKVKEIARYRALIKYLTIVQRAQLVASQYDGKLARYQLMQNAVFSASSFFQVASDLESVEAFIEYSRNDLSDYLAGIEYTAVRPFVELRRAIYTARGTNDFEKIYEQLNDLRRRCGTGTPSTNKIVLSLREQLGIPDGEIDGLTAADRFHLTLAKGNLPVSAQTRYTVTGTVGDELKAGSFYSGSFNISSKFANIDTSCNAKIDSIEVRFVSKEGKKIRESGTANPVISLFYGGQTQLLSCHSNIDAIVKSIGPRTTYGKFSTFNIKPYADGINAGIYDVPEGEHYEFSDNTEFTGVTNYKGMANRPMIATYTVVFDPSKGNNDKIIWDNVADIELQINYTTGSLGANSDTCNYDIEG